MNGEVLSIPTPCIIIVMFGKVINSTVKSGDTLIKMIDLHLNLNDVKTSLKDIRNDIITLMVDKI